MGKILSDSFAVRVTNAVNTVEGMSTQVQTRLRRRIRTPGAAGGGENPYLRITSVTDRNNYEGDVIDPVTELAIKEDVTIKALQPTAGGPLLTGEKMFAASVVDDIYYIQPAVVLGN